MTDIVDVLEQMGSSACWAEPSQGTERSFSVAEAVAAIGIIGGSGNDTLMRALKGERLHVNIAPAEEDDEEGDEEGDEESPKPGVRQAG